MRVKRYRRGSDPSAMPGGMPRLGQILPQQQACRKKLSSKFAHITSLVVRLLSYIWLMRLYRYMIEQTEQGIHEGVSYSDEVAGMNGYDQPSRYVVHLPVFEGPLDLLLHLIEKRQMEITTISLVAVTDQYLAYLQQCQEPESMPLANMAAFISIATRLLYIKSQSLLPHTSKEEITGEMEDAAALARERLTHLSQYKFAKEIARYLRLR